MNKWHTYTGTPAERLQEGQRVALAYGDALHGTIQSVDTVTGMARVWWDGKPCPGYGPTEATNIGNLVMGPQ